MPLKWLVAFILFFSVQAFGSETSTLNSSVRALGMGDAFTAVADNEAAMFYNPAGLARVRGLNLKIFDVGAGASGVETFNKVKDLEGGSGQGFADALNSLYGDHLWTGLGGEAFFTMPMFGI
jgi:hypothetical protein